MSKNKRHYQVSGVTLISLIVGVAVSSFLLLMVTQLAMISKRNYNQSQNLIELSDNAREAMAFLTKNIQMSGFGIMQPVAADFLQLNSTSYAGPPPTGGSDQLKDWVYIGYYQENPSPNRLFPNEVIMSGATPASCAASVSANLPTVQFFGLQSCGQCWTPNPANSAFDKTLLTMNPADTTATCCNPLGASCTPPTAGNCGIYNCGGSLQNAVYQKMMQTVCVGKNCPGADAASMPSGDSLTVYFSNPGPGLMATFTESDVPAATTQPPAALSSYTFYADSVTATLKAKDSFTNLTYNMANNVEYMAVLVGESDLYSSVNIGTTYSVPNMSRFVTYNTANLYPYRITAIRVAIIVRSQDQILPVASSNTTLQVLRGNNGNWITYTAPSDRYLRKVFTKTIYLQGYGLPAYRMHCVQAGGSWYMKTGGIPYATTWMANDQCCGGSPCTAYTQSTCETQRMTGACW
ncbi:MAG TPA: PilW family protein [Gammaproteobacteria bacterium]|nr:PilW family protein [Gammaproteobacteria bacterium]